MEFVWMKHDGVGQPAKVPATAVQHWEGNGWQRTDPPVKTDLPPSVMTADEAQSAAAIAIDAPPLPTPPTGSPVDEAPTGAKTETPKAAPSGRKED